jgi:hypothetical protein
MTNTKSKKAEHGDESDHLAGIRNDLAWTQRIGWAIAGGFAVVFTGLITWYLPKEFESNRQLLKNDTVQQLNPISQDIAVLKSQVAAISTIIPQLMKEKLKAKGPELKNALESVANIARTAREKQIETESAAVGEVGVKVVRIGDANGGEIANAAWQATTELLNYRSFLNSKDVPDISGAVGVTQSPVPFAIEFTGRALPPYPGYPYPAVPVNIQIQYVGPISSIETSALLESLGQKPEERRSQQGPKYYVVEGKGIEFSLDGYRMRNVIFKNAAVAYDGGPAAIQNIYLVNCTFRFKPTPEWKRLSEVLFAKVSVNFSKTSSP